jgi:hypothetical protein
MAIHAHIRPGDEQMPVGGRGSETQSHPIIINQLRTPVCVVQKRRCRIPRAVAGTPARRGLSRIVTFCACRRTWSHDYNLREPREDALHDAREV